MTCSSSPSSRRTRGTCTTASWPSRFPVSCDLTARKSTSSAARRNSATVTIGTVRLPVPMVTVDELRLAADDVLFLAVKSQDTGNLLGQLAVVPTDVDAGHLPVFCAQNGVANEDAVVRHFDRVYGVCVNIPATHLEPGVVEAPGTPISGILQLGRYAAGADDLASSVAADLRRSGFLAEVRTDVMAWKRAKLLSNLANALQVLCVGGYEWRAGNNDVTGTVVSRMRAEAGACFAAAGWTVTDTAQFRAEAGAFQMAAVNGQKRGGGSTWQSVERGLPSVETDYLNGEIVRLGRLHGVSTPVNAAIQAAMREVIRRSRAPRTLDPADLLAA